MLRNARAIFTAFLLIVITSGCEKYLEFEGENATPRLVLNGLFTADSTFAVELSRSQGYIEKGQLSTIENGSAAVFKSNGEFVDSLYHTSNGIYRSNTLAVANERYEVRASAGGLGSVSATDYTPEIVPIASWDTTTVSVTEFDYTSDRVELSFTVNDPSDRQNFYVLELVSISAYYIDYIYDPNTGTETMDTIYYDNPYEYRMGFSTSDQVLISEADQALDETLYYSSSLAFSDALFNGRTQKFRILIDGYQFENGYNQTQLRLKSCSEAYYKYKRTLENYSYSEGDPFAQPVQVFSNIENGLGIWAGYSVFEVEL